MFLVAAAAACARRESLPGRIDALLRHCLGDEVRAFHRVEGAGGLAWVSDGAEDPADTLALASFFHNRLRATLAAPELALPPHLLVITNSNRAARVRAFLSDGRAPHALATPDALVFFGRLDGPGTAERLAHELAHAALRSAFPSGLPLWLEEGLAQHWASVHTRAWLAIRQIPHEEAPAPELGPPPAGAERLTNQNRYPDDPARVEAVYRQSRRFAAALDAGRGDTPWPDLLRALAANPAGWRETLTIRFHFSQEDMQRLDDLDLLRP